MRGTSTRAASRIQIQPIIYLTVILQAMLPSAAFSQGEISKWFFGNRAGIDFTSGAPVSVNGGMTSTFEGSAVASDANGNLLFYTDGVTVWSKDHSVMTNGTDLGGDFSSTQSALIIKKPGSQFNYYIFTTDNQGGENGVRMAEVDMRLNNGKGSVISKNTMLSGSTTERLTAIKHCNNKDIWVITHDFGSNVFRSFLITDRGLYGSVQSSAGLAHSSSWLNSNTVGYMKASPDGKRIAIANYGLDLMELFQFDNSTGMVSNAMSFTNYCDAYGIEFSPDGSKLYLSLVFNPSIYQFDLSGATYDEIASSVTVAGISGSPGALQLGPDGKIYIVQYKSSWLDAISNPNGAGTLCSLTRNAVSIAPATGEIGLPNFTSNIFTDQAKALPVTTTLTIDCLTGVFSYVPGQPTASTGPTQEIVSIQWNFGDPASGIGNYSAQTYATHTYNNSGTYHAMLIVNYTCYTDTVHLEVNVRSCELRAEMTGGEVCEGTAFRLNPAVEGGTPPYRYDWSPAAGDGPGPHDVTPASTTTYTLTVTDSDNRQVTATATVFVNPVPRAKFSTVTDAFSTEVLFTNESQGATTFTWSFGDSQNATSSGASPAYTFPATGIYTVALIAKNEAGCADTCYNELALDPELTLYVPNAFSPNGDGLNDRFFPQGSKVDIGDIRLQVYNRWGQLIYEADEPWDGLVNGNTEPAPADVYVWKITTGGERQIKKEMTGILTLLR